MARPSINKESIIYYLQNNVLITPLRDTDIEKWDVDTGMKYKKDVSELMLPLVDRIVTIFQ